MKSNFFDLDNPIMLNMQFSKLKNQFPIVYPIKLSILDQFLLWECIWCEHSYYTNFDDPTHPLPSDLLGCCELKRYKPLHLRVKKQYCKLFEPIEEYKFLIDAKLMVLEFRISQKDFLFL